MRSTHPPPTTAAPANGHAAALREQLAELHAKLDAALAARKARMKELAELARRERLALREQIREMRARALRDLENDIRAARAAAKVTRVARLEQAKRLHDSAIGAARAAIRVELEHQAEERRIAEEARRRRAAIEKNHAQAVSQGAIAANVLGRFGPLFEYAARKAVAGPGESKTEAVLRHIERNPHEAHAVLEPAKEQVIATTRAKIAAAKQALRNLPRMTSKRRKGQIPREGGGIPVADLLREREELAVAKAARAKGAPPLSPATPVSAEFRAALERFREKAERELNAQRARSAPTSRPLTIAAEPGARYVRLVKNDGNARSVYGFVDTTNGDVLNAASWKKPKQPRRGSIYGEMTKPSPRSKTPRSHSKRPSAKATRAKGSRRRGPAGVSAR